MLGDYIRHVDTIDNFVDILHIRLFLIVTLNTIFANQLCRVLRARLRAQETKIGSDMNIHETYNFTFTVVIEVDQIFVFRKQQHKIRGYKATVQKKRNKKETKLSQFIHHLLSKIHE